MRSLNLRDKQHNKSQEISIGGIGLNTNDEKIQWHPAFDAALQIEFGDEAKYLEFDPEHFISKKPMQIDVLVKNEKHVKLRKNIGRIFR